MTISLYRCISISLYHYIYHSRTPRRPNNKSSGTEVQIWGRFGVLLVPWGAVGGERGRHFHEIELRRVPLLVLASFDVFWGVVLEAILTPKI